MLSVIGCSDDDPVVAPPVDPQPQPPVPTAEFSFETLELTQGSLKIRIIPQDENMTYYFGILEQSAFEKYEDLEKLQTANNENIRNFVAENGITLDEFLMEALLNGVQEWRYNTLTPSTNYVFYAYGLSSELEILSKVNTFEFQTPEVTPIDINFKITATDVTPTSFTLNIEPDRTDCAYYYDILLPAAYQDFCGSDPENIPAFVEAYLKELKNNEHFAAYDLPQFIAAVTSNGNVSNKDAFKNLLPEGTYYAFAVSVANDGTCNSKATVEAIKTSETPKNNYTISSETITDVSYSAAISADQSEPFAVMMELQEYFADVKSDSEIIQMLYDAHHQDLTNFLNADAANVKFNGLIPNDNYYLMIFACNPDGTPKLDKKINLKKVEIKTQPAKMSNAKYTLRVANVTKTTASATVIDENRQPNETFLLNYITKAEYDAFTGDKTEGLHGHMDTFIDSKVDAWNQTHDTGVMSRKEFLSRALMNGEEDTYVPIDLIDLDPGTTYYAYVIGLKADGTYTTEPVMTEFTTVADQKSLAKLEFSVMAYTYEDSKQDMYMIWVYPSNSYKHFFQTFAGTDEWADKTPAEILELLQSAPWPTSSSYDVRVDFGQTWYGYAVAYDDADLPTKIYKLQHTSPTTGEGAGMSGREVKVEIVEL